MNVDVLESLSATFSGPIIKQVSWFLGESEAGTRSALGAIMPTLLGSLMQRSATTGGAAELHRSLSSDSIDTGIAGKLASLLGNRGSLEPLLTGGQQLVGSLPGNRTGGATHAVSQVAGISPSSATALFSMAAPVLLGFLKKQVTQLTWAAVGAAAALLGGWIWNSRPAHRTPVSAAVIAPERSSAPLRVAALPAKVYFETGKASVAGADRQAIAALASSIRGADGRVAVTGYADRTVNPEQNLALARDRATAVRDALMAEGVSESRIVMAPPALVTGSGPDAEARRVEITLTQE